MVARIGVLCACLLIAAPAAADTVVTWVGEGEVSTSYSFFPASMGPAIPIGTPISVSLTFDPAMQIPTPGQPAGTVGCMQVPVSGSVTLGGFTYNSPNSLGFTQGMLPGSNCSPGIDLTQFSLHDIQPPPDSPWPSVRGPGVFILLYRDLLVQDAFPSEPTLAGMASLWFDNPVGRGDWGFTGTVSLRAADVDQTPVPEPATLTLFGAGLALAHRARRRRSNANV